MTEVLELRTHKDDAERLAPGYIHKDTDGDWWITREDSHKEIPYPLPSGNFRIVTPYGSHITKFLFVADWEAGSQPDITAFTVSVPLKTW